LNIVYKQTIINVATVRNSKGITLK